MKRSSPRPEDEEIVQICVNNNELFALTNRGRILEKTAGEHWVLIALPTLAENGWFK